MVAWGLGRFVIITRQYCLNDFGDLEWRESLWRKVVVARFGEKTIWDPGKVKGRHGCGIWKSIYAGKKDFWKCIRFNLGECENISFWNDIWVGVATLRVTCLNIYQLDLDPQASIASCYDVIRKIWCSRLRRDPNDWEVGELLNLLEILGNMALNGNKNDGWTWKLNQKGCFTSKLLYHTLLNYTNIGFPHNGIWIPNIPFRVSFFLWTCFLDKILTLDHLQCKGWNLANRCIRCRVEEESVSHSLIQCPVASRVWYFCTFSLTNLMDFSLAI